MEYWFHAAFTMIACLFPIMNPVGNAPIFLSMTSSMPSGSRHQQALMGTLYSFGILVVFVLAGSWLMHFFGLSMQGIRIAGGLIVGRVGLSLLQSKQEDQHSREEHEEAKQKKDISFTPLAMPLLAGPGAIAAVMGQVSFYDTAEHTPYFALITGIAATCAVTGVILRFCEPVVKFLGVNGTNALTRMMGFILLCIGVQLIIDGAQELAR